METTNVRATIREFMAQKRLAVAGVSRNESQHGTANFIYRRLKKSGHEMFPVSPNLETFEGDRCYPDVSSIPGGVDGVVIVTRPEITEKIVEDCSKAGVPRVWMHQSVAKATSISPKAVDHCHDHGIEVIEGGCPMMYGPDADLGHRCMRWVLKIAGRVPA